MRQSTAQKWLTVFSYYPVLSMQKGKLKTDGSIKAVFACKTGVKMPRPLIGQGVPAGFPSPAQDYIEGSLDLNEQLIKHPASTFFLRADGNSMIGAGIYPEDLLVVDRSIEVENNDIVVAIYDGELILKRFRELDGEVWLCAENPEYPDLLVKNELDFHVWGVVTYVIHKL